jgi:heptosyltransferase-2
MLAAKIERLAAFPILNTAGKLSLNELIALMSLTDLTITADTAVMHMAAALNVPLVAIFGAGQVNYCKPLSANHLIVKKEMGCSGCGDRCYADGYPPCLEAISPTMVFEAAQKMLMKEHYIDKEGG